MNVQAAVDQAGRLIEGVQRQARGFFSRNSDTEEPSAGAVWEKVHPDLEKALAIYDRKESAKTPESSLIPSWIPGHETKKSCQEDIDEILDRVLTVLETCGAAGYRARIRNLQADNRTSQSRVAKYREQMLSAPAANSQKFAEELIVSSKEALRDNVDDETDHIAERNQQVESLKTGFRDHLDHIGIHVSPETADSFLLPVEDDIVSMAAVISNIGLLTEQLQNLVEASKESPAETKRYYGMYVLLVFALDRIQTHFVQQIDQQYLPSIAENEQVAVTRIAEAQAQIKGGGPREALESNIAANRTAIEACHLLANMLRSQQRSVLDDNWKVRIQEAAAVNTYKTVCLCNSVAELVGYCQSAFRALHDLKLLPLRPFQNVQLNQELQNLAERVAARK